MTSTTSMTSPEQPLEIHRSEQIDLAELDLDSVWELMSTEQGWSSWLVDETELEVVPGRSGVVRDDGRQRVVRVDTVVDRRRVGFTWWDREDPGSMSYVELALVELDSGRARIDITERFIGSATASASPSSRRSKGLRWEAKLLLLCLLAAPALAKA